MGALAKMHTQLNGKGETTQPSTLAEKSPSRSQTNPLMMTPPLDGKSSPSSLARYILMGLEIVFGDCWK